jgi:hypothetical protein
MFEVNLDDLPVSAKGLTFSTKRGFQGFRRRISYLNTRLIYCSMWELRAIESSQKIKQFSNMFQFGKKV